MVLDVYCRISRDGEGAGLGVARQEKDCRAHLVTLGHPLGEVLVDNDISAYKRKARPAYEQLLRRVRDGASDGFVVWHLDRLTRHPRELEDIIDVVERAHATVLTVTGGAYDLTTTDGRAMARVVGAFARKESEDKARRTRAKHVQLAQQGRAVGGTRHFGYEPLHVDGVPVLLDHEGYPTLKVRESEAALIRDAAAQVLAGRSVRSIVKGWNHEGYPSARGGRMTAAAVQRILRSPTIAGWRSLDGERVAPGRWEAIVPDDVHRQVVAMLDGRAAAQAAGFRGGKPRTYLLSGLLRCGRCGCRMVSQAHSRGVNTGRKRSYTCPSDPSVKGCGGVRIVAPDTEHEVLERILARLSDDLIPEPAPDDPTRPFLAELEQVEARLAELASDYYVHRRITAGQFHAASGALTDTVAGLRGRLAATSRQQAVSVTIRTADDLRAAWDDMDIGQQRAVVDQFVTAIVIHPAMQPRGRFDPDRVEVLWV